MAGISIMHPPKVVARKLEQKGLNAALLHGHRAAAISVLPKQMGIFRPSAYHVMRGSAGQIWPYVLA